MEDRTAAIAALLHEAGETHHLVYRIVDGEDPDWASWYADHLLRLTHFPEMVDKPAVRSELVYMLVKLDKEQSAAPAGEKWEDRYAGELLAHFR